MVKSGNKIPGVIIIARMLQPEGVPKMGSEGSAFVKSSPDRVLGLQQSLFVGQILCGLLLEILIETYYRGKVIFMATGGVGWHVAQVTDSCDENGVQLAWLQRPDSAY